ncbi:hypothetical protein Hanom_Chr06g00565621 [Helianthus anomalus]
MNQIKRTITHEYLALTRTDSTFKVAFSLVKIKKDPHCSCSLLSSSLSKTMTFYDFNLILYTNTKKKVES